MLDKLLDLLIYNPSQPLIFTTGLFLGLFLIFSFFYSFMRRATNMRIIYLTLFSLFFYYKTSGFYFLLLIFTATSDFTIGHFIGQTVTPWKRKLLVALSITINVGILVYFKYTDFFIGILNDFVEAPLDFTNIFLPIGISFFTFQSMSYIIDIYRLRIPPLKIWGDYLFYVSFFPQLVAGPIVRARDFIPQIRRRSVWVTRAAFAEGVFLILCGLFKKAIISDYISMNFVDRIFDDPMLYTGFENLMGVIGYSLQIYCDFSGYSDMAIGLALLLGFRFNINFNSPYKSATITEFWRRWHISLSSWLKDYLYISLGGNRKGQIRTYINLMLTMLIGGLWHGAALRFVLWGAIHGAALAIHKWVMGTFPSFKAQGEDMPRWRRVLGIAITFMVVCASWVYFRSSSVDVAHSVFYQIFVNFHPEIIWEFVVGYKWVVLMMIIGFVLHFSSDSMELKAKVLFTKIPIWVYPLLITAMIWTVMQLRTGDVQPFIYFQF